MASMGKHPRLSVEIDLGSSNHATFRYPPRSSNQWLAGASSRSLKAFPHRRGRAKEVVVPEPPAALKFAPVTFTVIGLLVASLTILTVPASCPPPKAVIGVKRTLILQQSPGGKGYQTDCGIFSNPGYSISFSAA